jgi:hypothetical protein
MKDFRRTWSGGLYFVAEINCRSLGKHAGKSGDSAKINQIEFAINR